jgi:hypothetical protein
VKKTTKTCIYHCRGHPFGGCDSHFTSLDAFDGHREGPYDGERVCVEPADVDGLELVTAEGRCDHIRPRSDAPVRIWGVVISEKQRAGLERLSAARGRRETGSEAKEGE